MEKDEIRKLNKIEKDELKVTKMIYYSFISLITKITDKIIEETNKIEDQELKKRLFILQSTYKTIYQDSSNKLKQCIQIEKEKVYLEDDYDLVNTKTLDNIKERLNGENGFFTRYKQRMFYSVSSCIELKNFNHPVIVKEEEITKVSNDIVNIFINAFIANILFEKKVKENKIKLSEAKEKISKIELDNNMTIQEAIDYIKTM